MSPRDLPHPLRLGAVEGSVPSAPAGEARGGAAVIRALAGLVSVLDDIVEAPGIVSHDAVDPGAD
jgi:hypothetical protein